MAAELQKAFGGHVDIQESSGGVFEVQCDTQLIFSKKNLGRFPEDGEVLSIVNALNKGVPLAEATKRASAR